MSRAWFKFYGRDYRDGVRDLPFDVVGIYSVLLTYMYEEEGGRIQDQDQRLARLVGCDIRVWKRARATLIEAGKLSVTEDGFLTNGRVEIEVKSAELLSEVRAKSGRSSRQLTDSNKPKSLKSESPPEAIASVLPLYARASPESESDIPTSLRSVGSPASKPKRSAPRPKIFVPADLPITDRARAFAAERGFINGSVAELWLGFTSWHAANRKLTADVEASWQTWVIRQGDRNGNRSGPSGANSAGHGSRPRGQPRSAATIIMESAAADALQPEPDGTLFGGDDAEPGLGAGLVPRRVGGVGAG